LEYNFWQARELGSSLLTPRIDGGEPHEGT
jgi:hypothetical protein